jgi:hypothetical protein
VLEVPSPHLSEGIAIEAWMMRHFHRTLTNKQDIKNELQKLFVNFFHA